jgi:hypothetical protein
MAFWEKGIELLRPMLKLSREEITTPLANIRETGTTLHQQSAEFT